MRIANVADVHLGNHRSHGGAVEAGLNRRATMVIETLQRSYLIAQKKLCEVMIINGDLFDTSKPLPQHIAAAQQVIRDGGMPTYVLMGNHDMESSAEGDHALGPLVPVATVITKPTKLFLKGKVDAAELWAVPFRPGRAEEWLPLVMAEVQGFPAPGSPASSSRVLALHLGLRDGKTPPWLAEAHDSVPVELLMELMAKHDIKAAYAGNWHDARVWDFYDKEAGKPRRIVQVGTLCPTGWDNPGLEFGTMAVFDAAKPKHSDELRVPGPRFVSDEADALRAKEDGCTPFLRVRASPDEVPAVEQRAAALRSAGVEVEIVPDAAEAVAALRTAAGVARKAETVEDAVAGYVAQMPLEEPELRPAVLEKVKALMAGSDT